MKRFREILTFQLAKSWFGMVCLTSHPTSWISTSAEETPSLLPKGTVAIACRRASGYKAQPPKFLILIYRPPLIRGRSRTRGRNRRCGTLATPKTVLIHGVYSCMYSCAVLHTNGLCRDARKQVSRTLIEMGMHCAYGEPIPIVNR